MKLSANNKKNLQLIASEDHTAVRWGSGIAVFDKDGNAIKFITPRSREQLVEAGAIEWPSEKDAEIVICG
jgi:hypothetical protein